MDKRFQSVEAMIRFWVMEEEKRFRNTLDEGIQRLKDMITDSKGSGILSGEAAFKLYDTYGFPLELTHEISGAENIKVDVDSFERLMENQRAASKSGSKIKNDIFQQTGLSLNIELLEPTVFIYEDREEIETSQSKKARLEAAAARGEKTEPRMFRPSSVPPGFIKEWLNWLPTSAEEE